MAETLQNLDKIANDTTFQSCVHMGLAAGALAIFQEDPATANHDNRKALANDVLHANYSVLQISRGLLLIPAVNVVASSGAGAPNYGVPDELVTASITGMWNAFG